MGGNNSSSCPLGVVGCGVLFRLDASGNERVQHTFTGGADGAGPTGLIADTAGNLYGTTIWGGNTNGVCGADGCGVVFRLDTSGHEMVLYTFIGGTDGLNPNGGLIRDPAGNVYGTTAVGGELTNLCFFDGCGAVFKLDPLGNETVLHSFTAGEDGSVPETGLTRDGTGNLYGTTYWGGSGGEGVVFELGAQGQPFAALHSFSGGADGAHPVAGLIRDGNGNLYGTARYGGNATSSCPYGSVGCGVVFKLSLH